MKKQLIFSLILILFFAQIFYILSSPMKRFVQYEEISIDSFSPNPDYSQSIYDINKICYPIYNSVITKTRRLEKTIFGFSLDFNILSNTLYANNDYSFDVNIYRGDMDNKNIITLPFIETCYNSYELHIRHTIQTFRINCNTRKFKKDYIVAICPTNRNVNWSAQNIKIRISGYVDPSEPDWVSTVAYLDTSNNYEIKVKRFDDEGEANSFYDAIPSSKPKRQFYQSKKDKSNDNSSISTKTIPTRNNKPTDDSKYWVSYLKNYNNKDGIYTNIVKFFTSQDDAQAFYDSLNEDNKQFTSENKVKAKKGELFRYLL